ncbi:MULTISPECIES: 50S ribosomal protein L24 [Petrocella]|uniref:Large ribosomal subunit protein uL24 n=1 Tax=Petrocella atlantisensis TaxID=2173034 RepID=A0A3P7S147_9FIRM|nr:MULTISPECIES: 50S ribosomal protein L24 [Petrocella]MCF8019127.1 50S ribosomal protein L24 [Vallitaleaceae bacterium]MDF1616026.1 50S ribosomal protein L24 [Petrocella sp. FN5]VDN48586.1 ribosomal protein L24 (BL23) [Petrocella atlantisensis]
MSKMKLKTGDTVKVITGKDKGKEGKILDVNSKSGRVLVEGINKATKHTKPSAANQQGGIIHKEAMIDASNVMYMHKGKPTKLGAVVSTVERNGKTKTVRKRVAKTTGEVVDK